MAFTRNRIRLEFEITKPFEATVDKFSGANPIMPRGRAVDFEIALLNNGTLDGLANITSAKLEVKSLANGVPDTGAAVMSKTVSAADFNADLTQAAWDAGTGRHFTAPFDDTETGLEVGESLRTNYYLVLTAQTSAGKTFLGCATLTVQQDAGLTVETPPPVGDPTYVRTDDYIADQKSIIKKVNPPGTSMIFYNADGYGIELYVTDGANPELKSRMLAPEA